MKAIEAKQQADFYNEQYSVIKLIGILSKIRAESSKGNYKTYYEGGINNWVKNKLKNYGYKVERLDPIAPPVYKISWG